MSMIETIAAFSELETAAKDCAGNHQRWSHFMWMGEAEFERPENIMLGYMTGQSSNSTIDVANARVVARKLKPFMGMAQGVIGATADTFGSSFCGDADVLSGFMVRVYTHDGKITEAFRKLFELSRLLNDDERLDVEVWNEVSAEEVRRYVENNLEHLCEQHDIPYSESLIEEISTQLIDDGYDGDEVDDEKILEALGVEVED